MSLTPPADATLDVPASDAGDQLSETGERAGMQVDTDEEERGFATATALSATSQTEKKAANSAGIPVVGGAGEMERRAEEKLLDVRIREKYQKEIGDIFTDD